MARGRPRPVRNSIMKKEWPSLTAASRATRIEAGELNTLCNLRENGWSWKPGHRFRRGKRCVVEGQEYVSMDHAAASLGIPGYKVRKRIRDGVRGYRLVKTK